MAPNPYILAADNSPALLPLLRENPSLAGGQDDHGYSLVHAAASYNHLDLLRSLIQEFNVPIDLKDEDGETALFVIETVDAAKALVELGLDPKIKNDEGVTAREKIEMEEEYPEVAAYLFGLESGDVRVETGVDSSMDLPPPPEGLQVRVGTMPEQGETTIEVDPEFRRRIEELSAREDFNTLEGQERLRQLVEDTIADQGLSEVRNVRPRQD